MRTRLVIGLAIALALSACGGTKPTAAPLGTRADGGVHLVVAMQGTPSVKRQGWSDYAPATFGMALRSGDLLRLDGSSQATLACADLTLAKASGGVSNVPCKVSKPVLMYGDSLISPTRANAPVDVPIVLSPRKTKLLTARPTLRWLPVADVASYQVGIRGPNLNWSTSVSGKTAIVYPDSAPALVPGNTYKVTVSTGSRSSDEEQLPGLGFTMLKPEESRAVLDGEARIRALGLSDAATRLLIANFYASQGLSAEAIEQLEELTMISKEPAIVRLLGDLYLKVGLNRLAEERYGQALVLSQQTNDIEGQAAAQNALSLVYEALGNKAEALQRSQKAIEWYQKLGDSATIKRIQERITTLQKP